VNVPLEPSGLDRSDDLDDSAIRWRPATGISLAVLALLGLAAAFTLSVDRVRLLVDPDYVPSCNFNPILSCGSVMTTDQAQVFGFPNPFLGLIGFAIILTVGVVLAAGVRLPAPFLLGAATGSLLGLAFVHWLIFQSLYRIGALCPWCMVVWTVTMPIALWFSLAAADRVGGPTGRRTARAIWEWRFTVLAVWYLVVVLLILIRFWDYWRTLV
jgi:uncharacterized membrane protein